ncbi:hypothetical protein XELAEV_18041579mg [Xenopus laevis]|uniref:Uncharacterized protein n=1 Tax=Xenopus laevis TaxID=8355 RepID=A0A974C298_XENLA|nr:hypothetical protein XELAEV_18041579mg [Xenopus laevis]
MMDNAHRRDKKNYNLAQFINTSKVFLKPGEILAKKSRQGANLGRMMHLVPSMFYTLIDNICNPQVTSESNDIWKTLDL